MSLLDGTTQFHNLAELPTAEWVLPGSKTAMGKQSPMTTNGFIALRDLRLNLLKEEVTEYIQGELTGDIVEIVDGLLDTIVIAWGTLLAYVGEDKAITAANEVVRSNLSKVDGSLGPIVRREDGKLLKPPGWTPPDIEGALET